MQVKYDALLDEVRENDASFEVVAALPASGFNGQALIKSSDSTLYAWYANQWQAIFTFPIVPVSGSTTGQPIGLLLALTKAA